eukprot:TRINITY_DN1271_c0_g1_i3.p1 TRINITY_DN1271_c0_g1~~TRINITY_DN1271_c0_g1_i3.p1  ORF type:complete len:3009 (-),score=261.11 TRINITY_DN1271_c0_g1_i3:1901-10927(-)
MTHAGVFRRSTGMNVLILLLVGIFVVPALGILRPHKCSLDALPERLPNSLNTLSYLNLNKEFHFHGEFFVNFTEEKHQLYFELAEESAVRLYVAPHKTWDIDVYLFNNASSQYIDHSGLDIFTEEVIQATLPAGSYRFQFSFLFGWLYDWEAEEGDTDRCETLVMELAIVPKTRVLERTRQFTCESHEVLPDLDLSSISETTGYTYNHSRIFNVNTTLEVAPGNKARNLRMVRGYNFTLPRVKGSTGLWQITAELGYDFITSGSLGLMLDLNGETVETNLSCANDLASHFTDGGSGAAQCSIGVGDRLNENILRWVVESEKLHTLWLYDVYGESDRTLARCMPFSFKLSLQPVTQSENPLTCDAPFLPTSLNVPGLLSQRGYLNYREHVFIDLKAMEHNIEFSLEKQSNMRVFVEEHRVDIDLRLKQGSHSIASSLTFGKQETIVTELPAGNYTLNIKYFGVYDPEFCETFLLQVGIAPADYAPLTCNSTATIPQKPDLSKLDTMSDRFTSPLTKYRYSVTTGTLATKFEVFSKQFTLLGASEVKAVVGLDFILGDMELLLAKSEGEGRTRVYAEHIRDGLELHENLPSGTYTLTLSTASTQTPPPSLPNFPKCVLYTFFMDVMLETSVTTQNCWDYNNLTFAFTTADFVKSPEMHIQGSFLIPRADQALISEDVTFSVTRTSQFRIFSEPHIIDIDFHLSENNQIVASSLAAAMRSEEIVYQLSVGKAYTLTVQYYAQSLGSGHCSVFTAEASIAPIEASSRTCSSHLPPTDFIPSPALPPAGKDALVLQGQFSFGGELDSYVTSLSFNVTHPSLIRVTASYDFVFSHLALALYQNESMVSHGETSYNREDIITTQIPPGNYLLQIEETRPVTTTNARCLPFSLMIAVAPATTSTIAALSSTAYTGCHDYPLPSSFNSVSALSLYSGGQYHFQRSIIADVQTKSTWVDFHVNVTSVFRVFVPYHPFIDVDLVVYRGTSSNPSAPVGSAVTFDEESLVLRLEAGDFAIKFSYYGLQHHVLPPMSECSSFPIELAIVPLSVLEAIPAVVAQTCIESLPPTTLQKSLPFSNTFQIEHRASFAHAMNFSLSHRAQLTFELRYDFVSGGLAFNVHGYVREGGSTVEKTYQAKIGTNHAYLNEILPPGDYAVNIHDPSHWNTDSFSSIKCAQFQVIYYLNSVENDTSTSSCDVSEDLPVDFYTANGGSASYGGPQDSDGSVRIFGSKFLIPDSAQHMYIPFKIPTDSFIRIFTSMDEGNDVDFYVYHNNTDEWPVIWLNGFDNTESTLKLLTAQDHPYLLDVSFFRHNTEKECNYFQFGVEISPVARVYEELACPLLMPFALQRSISMSADHPVDIHGIYYFNKQQMDLYTTSEVFNYEIDLDVQDPTLLFADIAFDFLSADFTMLIVNGSNILTHGTSSMVTEENTEHLDFHNTVEITLQPGRYHLNIIERQTNTDLNLNTTHCHKFAFSLNAFSERVPHVISVSPGEGDALNPLEDLVISIQFTDRVGWPSTDNLQTTILTQHLAYLKTNGERRPSGGGHGTDEEGEDGSVLRIAPDLAVFADRGKTILLTWRTSSVELGKTYELVFDFSTFTVAGAGSNVFFTNANQRGRIYTFAAWDCNGHGVPNHNITHEIVCTCEPPYTGNQCNLCMDGYHSAGTECVADIKCQPNTCNQHGVCHDSAGYPECVCDPGYATAGDAFCSVCAEGYEGYPTCVPVVPSMDESNRCKAPLLPSSFNSPAYLGFDGEMRVYGHYFIDPLRREHDISFKIKEKSALRIYLAPHWVDVDVWLYKNTATGLNWIMHGGLAVSKEESLVAWLDPTVGDDYYLIRFRYYLFSAARPECETVNLDIAITPQTKVLKNEHAMEAICRPLLGSGHNLPNDASTVVDKTGYFYNPTTLFGFDYAAYNASHSLSNDLSSVNKPVYIWNKTLVLPKPPVGKIAMLKAAIGFRFVESSYGLQLAQGDNASHCDSTGFEPTGGCVVGDNLYNENVLHTPLGSGSYTVFIYLPRAPLASCAPFEFSLSVEFMDQVDDSFKCKSARFPASLNEPNYLDKRGSLHFQESYLLEQSLETVDFNLKTTSYFKVVVSTDLVLGSYVYLYRRTGTGRELVSQDGNGHIFASLDAGNYTFQVVVFEQLLGVTCPAIDLEMQIMPAVQINLHPDICGSNNPIDSLPVLPDDLGVRPFVYNSTGHFWFFTYRFDRITSYSITLSESMRLFAQVDSGFMGSGVELELVYNSPTEIADMVNTKPGTPDFNTNVMDKILPRGSYSLRIIRPTHAKPDAPLPTCAPFDFSLSLQPIDQQSEALALPCYGEELPQSLNTVRFLLSDSDVNFQARNWKIPDGRFPSHRINFSVRDKSLLRVYVEPHVVDIDMKLWQIQESQSDVMVTKAKNGFNEEEVLMALVDSDKQYALELIFWKWNTDLIPTCPTFNMEIAIQRTATISGSVCANGTGREHWPPAFPKTMPAKPYHYDSTNPTGSDPSKPELLYFQQAPESPKSHSYTFTLSDTADMYAEVGYDFAVGDLVLKLTNVITNDEYYGHNGYNRNYLSLMNLITGTYKLTIYEPPLEENPADLKCGYFTFRVTVISGADSMLTNPAHPSFPRDLTRLPFMLIDGSVHLQNRYTLFHPGMVQRTTKFNLTEESEFRLEASLQLENAKVAFAVENNEGSTLQSGVDQGYMTLPSGQYTLNLDYQSLVGPTILDSTVYSNLEIAIRPTAELRNVVVNFSSVADSCASIASQLESVAHIKPKDTITIGGSSGSRFSFRGNNLGVYGSSSVRPGYILGNLTFMIMEDAILYAKAGFDFLLEDLSLHIRSTNLPDSQFPHKGVYGSSARNVNYLNQLLPPGKYRLTLEMPLPSKLWSDAVNHCVPFSFTVNAQPTSQGHDHVDCLDFDQLPFNLNTNAGGSKPFGGPIVDGRVHISGDKFLLGRSRASVMGFNVTTKSVLSVFVSVPNSWNTQPVTLRLTNRGTNGLTSTVIMPRHVNSSIGQRLEQFVLEYVTQKNTVRTRSHTR